MVLLRRPRATQLAESAQFRITSSRERASRENTTPQPDHGDPQGRSTQNSRNSGHLHPTPDCHSIAEDQNGPSGPVATGPDPFPYRVPKVSHLYKNSLMVEFTDQLDEKNHRPEECYIKDDFSLGDFLLKRSSSFIPFREKQNRETSTQNYELNYQRNAYPKHKLAAIREITETLEKEVLTIVDVNRLAALDPVPRKFPNFLFNLFANIKERQMAPLPAGNILSEHKYAQDIAQGYSSQLHDHYGNSILAFDEDETFTNRDLAQPKSAEAHRNFEHYGKHVTTPIGPHFSRLTDYDEDRVQNISRNKRLLPLPYNALELAVHESLKESGGLTFSLRGWFLDDVPKLTPLQSTLVYLNLSFNCLQKLPSVVFECINLKVLKVRNNPLSVIPPEISKLRRLRILIAPFCRISEISKELFRLPLLLYLDLSYNRLSELTPNIATAKELRFLNLAGNEIRGIPAVAMGLNIEKVRLKNNFMKKAFWSDLKRHHVTSLSSLATAALPKAIVRNMKKSVRQELFLRQQTCDSCRRPFLGQMYRLLRPVDELWGRKNVPIIFTTCSWHCFSQCKNL